MSDTTIITNRQPRLLKYGYELAPKWRAEFDYLDDEEFDTHGFVEYRGWVYDVGEFTRLENSPFAPFWHGYDGDTYFSGALIHFCGDSDYVVMGRYYS